MTRPQARLSIAESPSAFARDTIVRAPQRILEMMRSALSLAIAGLLAFATLDAQTKRPPVRRPASKTPAKPAVGLPLKVPADATCPSVLGTGIGTKRVFCDVISGRDPTGGIVVKIPPHRGLATLSFDLHNRHTYSEEQVRARKAFARYTATVAVLAPDGTVIDRGVVQNEFRSAADLVDRIAGGADAGGLKAVAPTGLQQVIVAIPEGVEWVSLVGEKVAIERLDGTANYNAPGRPVAIVSNLQMEYKPAPAKRKR